MKEYDFEPIRGLPEALPSGEELLWQGAPRWTALALRAFHIRKVAIYFALLALWLGFVWSGEGSEVNLFQGLLWIAVLAASAIGALALLAWAMARSTVYTITSRRVVMRFGVALPMIMNLPFAQVRSVDLRRYADGTGDIPLRLAESARPSYVLFWPHARPWRFSPVQPMLRVIPDVDEVVELLGDALRDFAQAQAAEETSQNATDPNTAATGVTDDSDAQPA